MQCIIKNLINCINKNFITNTKTINTLIIKKILTILLLSLYCISVFTNRYAYTEQPKVNQVKTKQVKEEDFIEKTLEIQPTELTKTTADQEYYYPYKPAIKTYDENNGLPFMTVSDIAMDANGYLWATSYTSGVYFYNGKVWKELKLPNPETQNNIRKIIITSKEGIWFISETGEIIQYKNNNFKVWNVDNGLPAIDILYGVTTVHNNDDVIFFSSRKNGVIKYQNNKWSKLDIPKNFKGIFVTSICFYKTNKTELSFFLGSKVNGLALFHNNKWEFFNKETSALIDNNVQQMLLNSNNGLDYLWVGSVRTISQLDLKNKTWKNFTEKDAHLGYVANTLKAVLLPNGKAQIWAGFKQGGIAFFDGNKWTSLGAKQGIVDYEDIQNLVVQYVGNRSPVIWGANSNSGIFRIDMQGWNTLNLLIPELKTAVVSFDEHIDKNNIENNNSFWIASKSGLFYKKNNIWSQINTDHGIPNNSSYSIKIIDEKDSHNSSYSVFASLNSRLAKIQNEKLLTIYKKDLFANTVIFNINNVLQSDSILFDNLKEKTNEINNLENSYKNIDETLILGGTATFLTRNNSNGIWTERLTPLLKRPRIYSFDSIKKTDGSILLFAATPEGLLRYHNNEWKLFTSKNGLPNDVVNSIKISHKEKYGSYLLISTNTGSAFINLEKEDDGIQQFPKEALKLLNKQFIADTIIDDSGNIFIASTEGILRLTPDKYPLNRNTKFTSIIYKKEDGLPSEDINQETLFLDSKKQLWVGTSKGPAILLPDELKTNIPNTAKLLIENIKLNNQNMQYSSNQTFKYNQNNLFFEYAYLSFFHENDTKFKTQLIGLDEKASEWTDLNRKEYTTLPYGNYTFRVFAKDHWNREIGPVEYRFTISPPVWHTTPAYISYICFSLLSVQLLLKHRLKILEKKNQLLEEKVQARTLELQNQTIELNESNKSLNQKNSELDQKNNELDAKNYELIQKNHELIASQKELQDSYKRVDLIFSALSDALPGTVLEGKYQLGEKIGSGGFGAVYAATHLSLKRDIAIKVFRPSAGNRNVESLERFKREAISSCKIQHPNVVQVLDSGVSEQGIAYIVMERLNGNTLREELGTNNNLSPKRCLEILTPVCKALAYAHNLGLIHRDIKPDNIFIHKVDNEEIIKILDFGISKLINDADNLSDLTKTGEVLGTPTYMAPEIFLEKPVNEKSDVYALGILLYRMLSGQLPFPVNQESQMVSVALKHINETPPPIVLTIPQVDPKFQDILTVTLTKDPNERYSTIEFINALETAVNSCNNSELAYKTTAGLSETESELGNHTKTLYTKKVETIEVNDKLKHLNEKDITTIERKSISIIKEHENLIKNVQNNINDSTKTFSVNNITSEDLDEKLL